MLQVYEDGLTELRDWMECCERHEGVRVPESGSGRVFPPAYLSYRTPGDQNHSEPMEWFLLALRRSDLGRESNDRLYYEKMFFRAGLLHRYYLWDQGGEVEDCRKALIRKVESRGSEACRALLMDMDVLGSRVYELLRQTLRLIKKKILSAHAITNLNAQVSYIRANHGRSLMPNPGQ
jgi:hypothetical protein